MHSYFLEVILCLLFGKAIVFLDIYIYNYCSAAGHRITYSVATLSYDNYHANLRDYSNSLLSDLLTVSCSNTSIVNAYSCYRKLV